MNKDDVVQVALWGLFEKTLREVVATSLGIVSGKDYSIGLLGLKVKTLGDRGRWCCGFGNVVQEISDKGRLLQVFTLDGKSEFIREDGMMGMAIRGENIIG